MEKSSEKTATVADVIAHLEKNFRPEDRLAFFDEGGAWCELVTLPESEIGRRMFVTADKAYERDRAYYESIDDGERVLDDMYRMVGKTENEVIIF